MSASEIYEQRALALKMQKGMKTRVKKEQDRSVKSAKKPVEEKKTELKKQQKQSDAISQGSRT